MLELHRTLHRSLKILLDQVTIQVILKTILLQTTVRMAQTITKHNIPKINLSGRNSLHYFFRTYGYLKHHINVRMTNITDMDLRSTIYQGAKIIFTSDTVAITGEETGVYQE